MTNEQKYDLRMTLKNRPELTDKHIAALIDCAVSTVKKYRKVFCK